MNTLTSRKEINNGEENSDNNRQKRKEGPC